jgi:hypothetical protein
LLCHVPKVLLKPGEVRRDLSVALMGSVRRVCGSSVRLRPILIRIDRRRLPCARFERELRIGRLALRSRDAEPPQVGVQIGKRFGEPVCGEVTLRNEIPENSTEPILDVLDSARKLGDRLGRSRAGRRTGGFRAPHPVGEFLQMSRHRFKTGLVGVIADAYSGICRRVEDGGVEPFRERQPRASSRLSRRLQRFRPEWSRAPRDA